MFDRETEISALLGEHAENVPSSGLQERVHNLARFHADTTTHRVAAAKRIRFAVMAGVSGLVILASITLAPTAISAHTLNHLAQVIDGAKSMHFVMRNIATEDHTLVEETWYQGGNWRITDQTGSTTVWTNGTSYLYNPQAHTVLKQQQPKGPFAHGMKGFKMSDIVTDMTDSSHAKNVEITNRTSDSYQLKVDNGGVAERYIFTVDARTDLPRTMDCYVPKKGVWTKVIEGKFEFNQDLAADLFKPHFPTGTQSIDQNTYSDKVAEQFKSVIGFISNGSTTGGLKIRDVQVNNRGHVFIAYTGSYNTSTQWMEVMNSSGVKFVRANLFSQGGYRDSAIAVPKLGSINVSWWVPETPIKTFKPGEYTITLMREPRHSRNAGMKVTDKAEKLGSVSVPVSQTSVTSIPMYMTVLRSLNSSEAGGRIEMMGMPDSDLDLKRGEAYSLVIHYLHRFVTKNGTEIQESGLWDSGPVNGCFHDPNDLRKALHYAERELENAREVKKQTTEDTFGQAYFDLYMASRLLGRIKESDLYLKEACNHGSDYQKNAENWQRMEEALGNIPKSPLP